MGQVILVTGGARGGKSHFAEELAAQRGRVCYVATAEALDAEMAERIAYHRARRPAAWPTLEAPRKLADALASAPAVEAVLVDCLAVWASNRLLDLGDDAAPGWWDAVAKLEETLAGELHSLMEHARVAPWDLLLVTNEVGFGVVPPSRLGRAFRDLLGRLNQAVAAEADEVYLLVAGLPVALKALARQ